MKKLLITSSLFAFLTNYSLGAEIVALSGQELVYDTITKVYKTKEETPYADQKYMAYKGGSIVVNGDINVTLTDFHRYTEKLNEVDFVSGLIKLNSTKNAKDDTTDYSNASPSVVVKGTVRTVINGDTKIDLLYGGNGGNVDNATSTVGAVDLTINSGTFGSIRVAGGATSSVDGNVTLNMYGGESNTIYGAISGGTIGGTVSLNIANTLVNKNIYAGIAGSSSYINGGTRIVLSGTTKVSGNVTAGSWSSEAGKIKNGTSITLKDSANVLGTINGAGGAEDASYIEGDKVLNIESYNGTLDATIANIDILNISADSYITFTNSFNVETLSIEISQFALLSTDAKVVLADGTTFETLTLVGDFSKTRNTYDLSQVFGENTGVVLASMEENGTTFTVVSEGQEWTTENVSFENGAISFDLGEAIVAVPEASTYALILGAIALGFAVYRRRK
ncbi:MAG: hypothetical protein E7036_04855 [Opitutales bacterium]|nr:hypothetical protein [Opitutales bacterium]